MATGKRYYWLKLKESFMTSDTVDFLMSQTDGANYVVLYQMLCLKTINTEGRLSRTIGEIVIPYDVSKIQRDCKWFSLDTIRVALELYKRFGLVYEDQDGTLVLANHDEMVGSETDWASQKYAQRLKKPKEELLPASCESGVENVHTDVHDNVRTNVHTDIRDKILDNRDKEKRDRDIEKKNVCAEVNSTPAEPPIVSILCTKNEYYEVTKEQFEKDTEAYPAVDVMQEYRRMVRWAEVNPTKRKTKKGMPRFIYNWLSKEQNRGGNRNNNASKPPKSHYKPDGTYDYESGESEEWPSL